MNRQRLVLLVVTLTMACVTTKTLSFQAEPGRSGTQGEVRARPADVNTEVEIDAKSLATGSQTGAVSYVAWVKPVHADVPPQNIGVVTLDRRGGGKFRGLTPYRTFEVFVTAEKSPSATAPSGERVLSARIVDQEPPKG